MAGVSAVVDFERPPHAVSSPTEPRDLGVGVPGGVACTHGIAAVTVAAINGTGQRPPPGNTLLILRSGSDVVRAVVGQRPGQVAIDDSGSVAAIAVNTDAGAAVQQVDLTSGRVTSTVSLPESLQAEAMSVIDGHIFLVGGSGGVIIPVGSGQTTPIELPGNNVTSVWA